MIGESERTDSPKPGRRGLIKCVVWDLDDTLWEGTLLEDKDVVLRKGIKEVIQSLDRRGILNSVASKNDSETAMNKLGAFELRDYFLYPQICWDSKASSIKRISECLNIGLDAIAFVDDQEIERAEVSFSHPDVLCRDASCIEDMLDMPEMTPAFITEDSARRRQMYLSDIQRQQAEGSYIGPSEVFLATLNMNLTISRAGENDLTRAEELTVRTHQLNTTGYTYCFDELSRFSKSDDHLLLIADLKDKFGTYGRIGLVLVERLGDRWTIKLLLMSCRVMSRGVGTVLITHIANLARSSGARLFAEFIPNGRNRMMYLTYRLSAFKEVERFGDGRLLEMNLSNIQPFPPYIIVSVQD